MSASRLWIVILAVLSATVSIAADPSSTSVKSTESASKSPLDGLKYRLVGPFRGGRATGVTGVVSEPNTYYFGVATGGLWKTIDGGTSWKPLWDDFPEAAAAVGAVAVAPSDPKIVYAGTGEINIRGNVATGNGLYKSTDAGKTWRFSGLRDSQVSGRIIVDPSDSNIVLVAAAPIGRRCFMSTPRPALRPSPSIQIIPRSSMPACGRPIASLGSWRAADRAAASTSPSTAASIGGA